MKYIKFGIFTFILTGICFVATFVLPLSIIYSVVCGSATVDEVNDFFEEE